jgi:hypothetical protein
MALPLFVKVYWTTFSAAEASWQGMEPYPLIFDGANVMDTQFVLAPHLACTREYAQICGKMANSHGRFYRSEARIAQSAEKVSNYLSEEWPSLYAVRMVISAQDHNATAVL